MKQVLQKYTKFWQNYIYFSEKVVVIKMKEFLLFYLYFVGLFPLVLLIAINF